MATFRKISFVNGEVYHVFNRGIEKRPVFLNKIDYDRALRLIKFYRHKDIPIRFSKLHQQPEDIRNQLLEHLYRSEKIVEILGFALMPNHFHFLLKQKSDHGISTFISNFTNAYTKYFNTKNEREGHLFQGTFKAVFIENDEQLMHVSRYVHINPAVSSIVAVGELENYLWSSYPEYLGLSYQEISSKDLVLDMFKSVEDYKHFVIDQIDYGKQLEAIKHLILE